MSGLSEGYDGRLFASDGSGPIGERVEVPVTVTQADREAAMVFVGREFPGGLLVNSIDDIAGDFARHRATSCAERDRALAGAVKALALAANRLQYASVTFTAEGKAAAAYKFEDWENEARQALAALRALAPDGA